MITLTNKNPPTFTYDEIETISYYFRKVITICSSDSKRDKIPYCPYFIYKIVDVLFPDKDLREFVHFQKMETIVGTDKIWKNICSQIPEFTYRKTIVDN